VCQSPDGRSTAQQRSEPPAASSKPLNRHSRRVTAGQLQGNTASNSRRVTAGQLQGNTHFARIAEMTADTTRQPAASSCCHQQPGTPGLVQNHTAVSDCHLQLVTVTCTSPELILRRQNNTATKWRSRLESAHPSLATFTTHIGVSSHCHTDNNNHMTVAPSTRQALSSTSRPCSPTLSTSQTSPDACEHQCRSGPS
jgi:hypothetical protein